MEKLEWNIIGWIEIENYQTNVFTFIASLKLIFCYLQFSNIYVVTDEYDEWLYFSFIIHEFWYLRKINLTL